MIRHLVLAITFLIALAPGLGAQSIDGTYSLIKDSDGRAPKSQSVIKLTFSPAGIVSLSAEKPGETVKDTGRYSVRGKFITLHFKEMVWRVDHQPFSLEECVLTLPFMALNSSGAGSSTWQKEACSPRSAARKDAAADGGGQQGSTTSGSSAGVQSGRSSASSSGSSSSGSSGSQSNGGSSSSSSSSSQKSQNGPAPGPGPKRSSRDNKSDSAPQNFSQSKKPSCNACDYVRCLRESIEQKQKLKDVYAHLAQLYGKFYVEVDDAGGRVPMDTIDGGKTSPADFNYLLDVHSSYSEKELELTSAIPAPASCHYEGDQNLELATNVFSCRLDPPSAADVLAAAVPCHELYDVAMEHEGMHINACLSRQGKGTNGGALLITPEGKAKEEMAAYDMEITKLKALLQSAEAKCRFTCRCNGERFGTSQECQANCPISLRCPAAAANSCMKPDLPDGKAPPLLPGPH